MKRIPIFILAATIFASCSSPKKGMASGNDHDKTNSAENTSTGNDGSSFEKAIFINETGEGKGVDAEYAWLKKHYPGYKTVGQSLNNYKKKPYDIITITTADGETKKVYFDISKFFGKF